MSMKPASDIQRYFLELSYDGTHYCGWQVQKGQHTVQGTIEAALQQIFSTSIAITGCGRTDTGVHSSQFYAHLDLSYGQSHELRYKLNRILPPDIAVNNIYSVDEGLHARFDAVSRKYEYHLHAHKSPQLRYFSYYYPRLNDLVDGNIQDAIGILRLQKDFTALSKKGSAVKSNICDILDVSWIRRGDEATFTIQANRFLRGMVRLTVGLLLQVGGGKLSIAEFKNILEDHTKQSYYAWSVPAIGLSLVKVEYENEVLNNPHH